MLRTDQPGLDNTVIAHATSYILNKLLANGNSRKKYVTSHFCKVEIGKRHEF